MATIETNKIAGDTASDRYGGAGGVGYSTRAAAKASVAKAGVGSEEVKSQSEILNPLGLKGSVTTNEQGQVVSTHGQVPASSLPGGARGASIPDTVNFNPNTGQPLNPGEQVKNLSTGAIETQGSKFKSALANVQASGPAPQTAGGGAAGVAANLPTEKVDTSGIEAGLAEDKGWNELLDMEKEQKDSTKQWESLQTTYDKLAKKEGLESLNTEMMNLKNIIDGNEDMIRDEVTKAGGFATEGQVIAMTNARNKQNIINYNKLVDLYAAKEKHLDTSMSFASKDRELAQQYLKDQQNIQLQKIEYRDKFIKDAKETFQQTVKNAGGYGPVYEAYKNDPVQLARMDEMLGGPGSMAKLASIPQPGDNVITQLQNGKTVLVDKNTGKIVKDLGGAKPVGSGDGGVLSTLPVSIQGKVISMANDFGSSDIVKRFNATADAINTVNGINTKSTNPSDHQSIIYAFAKSLDPDSVVREGEYETIKKYAQSSLNRYGKEISNALNGTGFLSEGAIQNIKDTMNNNFTSKKPQYDNLYKEKSRTIDSIAGKPVASELLVNYSGGVSSSPSTPTLATPSEVPDGYYQASDGLFYKK